MKPSQHFISVLIIWSCALGGFSAGAQDVIKVHFLYGSKPAKGFRDAERKWFGGMLGGHVGIESDSGVVFNFMKRGKVHWFASGRNRNSSFMLHPTPTFWELFRLPEASVKKATVEIPISPGQRCLLDSISRAYLERTPYDYAFFGMRCGAATYEVLAQLGIVDKYSYRGTFMKIFYPKKLRKRLFRKAQAEHWTVTRQEGSPRRKWESD